MLVLLCLRRKVTVVSPLGVARPAKHSEVRDWLLRMLAIITLTYRSCYDNEI